MNYGIFLNILNEELQDWFDDGDETLADRVYRNKYGIDPHTVKSVPTDERGEYITNIETNSYNDQPREIFLNPKSLIGFDYASRGILMPNGDLYLTYRSAYHTEIIEALAKKGILPQGVSKGYVGIPEHFIAVKRVATTNEFIPSDVYYKNEDRAIQYIFNIGNKKNPQFYFTNPRYERSLTEVIDEELDDYFDDEESLVDKMYADRFGIVAQQPQKNKPKLESQGEFVGYLESNPDYPIYRNPENLDGFDSNCRGVVFANGNLYLCTNYEIYHRRLFDFLQAKDLENVDPKFYHLFPDRYVAVARVNKTNTFVPSESYKDESYPYIVETLSKYRNPNIVLQPQIYKRPSASKYEEKYTS